MLSNDFAKFFNNHLIKFFCGVFPFDKIPKTLKVGHFFIANTSESDSPGEHWFTVYRPTFDVIEIFDSLGVSNEKINNLKVILQYREIRKLKFNTTKLQSDESQSCGEYCIFFIYERLYNQDLSFKELLNLSLTDNCETNETIVSDFLKDLNQ